ncbi:MAG: D-alanyl-D-alanine carboxypeptidase [Lachnospiraceae bacterium]|nr:D-alanyl-D-alanine carboxypeptidase [Lachnospiraceae bacterium]
MKSTSRKRKRRRRNTIRAVLITVLILAAVLITFLFASCGRSVFSKNLTADDAANMFTSGTFTVPDPESINFINEKVNTEFANSALLFNITDNTRLYVKNIHDVLYPASTTKVLTAYCALKYGNLNDTLKISQRCVDLEPGASRCHFQVGDSPTLEQALYGLMICSGNDAGIAIAENISGSVEEFAKLMNKEAAALGAVSTHFLNPHGLHEEEHYTTAYDLYLIFREVVKNKKFREILTHASYDTEIPDESGKMKKFSWHSTNRYLTDATFKPSTVTILGTKTGYTNEAGSCLVTLAQDHYGKEYISVIMKTSDPGTVFLETTDMYNTLVKK